MRVFKDGRAALTSTILCLSFAVSTGLSAPAPAISDLAPEAVAHAQEEAVGIFREYLKIDTSNPPGNESKGALYLAKILGDNGFDVKTFETAPGRSGLYARLKGNGKKKAILLLNHIDVVPAKAEDWKHQPFGGEEVEGEIWGRGAVDMKSAGIAQLESLLMLKRSGKTLDRDVIFLATPDEEVGGTFGADWFIKHHADLISDAEFLFNEGAFIDADDNGKPRYCGVDVAEKSVLWLGLTARGDAGHASMPLSDSSANRLIRALAKVVDNPPGPKVLPAVREYFKRISPCVAEPLQRGFATIETSVQKPDFYKDLLKDKFKSSMLRNTISLTVLKSGYKTNVIPAEAYAELDCRLLPDVKKEKFLQDLKNTIGDAGIEIKVLDWHHADASPYDTECFNAISRVTGKEMPGVPVVPLITPWFTDSHWFRDLGICSYGFAPFRANQAHIAMMHGKDERLPAGNFKDGVKFMYAVLDELCAEKSH
jgi:acetylornithine deacetylase/succinyl-diaminopimelate desuccinylase-like protein